MISGRLEGIYGWIAINYVLGRFTNNNTNPSKFTSIEYETNENRIIDSEERPTTVGVLDMGGASAQIACKFL